METIERQRSLAPAAAGIERRAGLSSEEFLERYLCDQPAGDPDRRDGRLAGAGEVDARLPRPRALGDRIVEYQGGRAANPRFEEEKDVHRRTAPFDAFMALAAEPGNDAYITAYNSARNAEALSVLNKDLGHLDKFLARQIGQAGGMMWIGPAGTTTSLHHDLTNNLIAQLVGRKRLKLLPAAEVGKLYNHRHVFSGDHRSRRSGARPGALPAPCGRSNLRRHARAGGDHFHAHGLVAPGQVARVQRHGNLHQLPLAQRRVQDLPGRLSRRSGGDRPAAVRSCPDAVATSSSKGPRTRALAWPLWPSRSPSSAFVLRDCFVSDPWPSHALPCAAARYRPPS